uniref:uncharacterized protein LOC120344938 n=1 Tax=Styela clava TaxID=7725 RepID=UPI00193A640B|nr:uncharacterized protein LOC120344938 [Styela clava]
MTPDSQPGPVNLEHHKKKQSPGIPRSPNWSLNEIRILCSYVKVNYVRILGSHNDGPGKNAKRQRHWEKVTEMINEQSGQTRVWKQVRKKWVDLTYMVKSYKRMNKDQEGEVEKNVDDENMTPVIKEVLSAMNAHNSFQSSSSNEEENNEDLTVRQTPPPLTYDCGSDSNDGDDDDNEEALNTPPLRTTQKNLKSNSSNGDATGKIRKKVRMKVHRTYRMPAKRLEIVRKDKKKPRHDPIEIIPTKSPNKRIRYRGPHRRFNPYTNIDLNCWNQKLDQSREHITENSSSSEKRSNERISTLYDTNHDFRKELIEMKKEKILTERAKLSVMQDRLAISREQLKLNKNILFCLQKISHSLDTGYGMNNNNLHERRYRLNREENDINSYWMMRNMKNL